MNWLITIMKTAGASFPGSASLAQLHSEFESAKLAEKIDALEDPISQLHEKLPELSKKLYQRLKETDNSRLIFDSEFYKEYSKPLAALEARLLIKGSHAIGSEGRFIGGLRISDPSYMMYLCSLSENPTFMSTIIDTLESAELGKWLIGSEMQAETPIPLPVINAVFEIYERKGYGLRSNEIGACAYVSQV